MSTTDRAPSVGDQGKGDLAWHMLNVPRRTENQSGARAFDIFGEQQARIFG